MADLTIVTGMWGTAFERYGSDFLATFGQYWPAEVALRVYTDRAHTAPKSLRGRDFEWRPLTDCQGYAEFMARHAGDPEKNGRAPRAGWKNGDRAKGYSFRFDACRFAGQAFVPDAEAGRMLDGQVICWLDADVRTFSSPPTAWIEGLLGGGDVAYLGRAPKHSEIGFWATRLSIESRGFVMAFADLYRTDRLFGLKEWHSAYAWDDTRRWAEERRLIRPHNLTPGGSGHVWFQSPLKAHLDHLKGDRKAKGRSPERLR